MKTETGYAKFLDTSLYYEITGSGPDIVFLHGNPVDLRLWDYQVKPFTEKYRVLRYDMRGFGKSGNPRRQGYTHAEDLKALLHFLDIKETYVAGLSMGGGAAINFAISYPESTRALIAADPSLAGYKWSEEFLASMAYIPDVVKSRGLEGGREETLKMKIFQDAMKDEANRLLLTDMLNSYKGWHWLNRDTGRPFVPPAIERLNEIKAPALVIIGERDVPDFHNIAAILEEKIPNARKVLMKGIGHIVNMEAPEKFNEIVLKFLKEQE